MTTDTLADGYLASIIKLIKDDSRNIRHISPIVLNNKEVVLKLVTIDEEVYQYLPKTLRADRDVALASIKEFPYNITQAKDFIDDDEIVKEAIKVDGELFEYASKRLKNDKNMALLAMKAYPWAFTFLSKELRRDEELAKIALSKSGGCIADASKEIQNNKAYLLLAVANDGLALEYTNETLQDDIEIVKKAVHNNGDALEYASDRLKKDKTLVLSALRTAPALRYAHHSLKKDLDVVMSALFYDNTNNNRLFKNRPHIHASLKTHPAVQFMLTIKDKIPTKQWPFIKKALLEHTDAFLNPPAIIKELTAKDPNRYLILAEYALKQKSLNDLSKHITTDIDFI